MTESFTRLQDISAYTVHYRPQGSKPALWDCPKVISDAAYGHPPKPKLLPISTAFKYAWPICGVLGICWVGVWGTLFRGQPLASSPLFITLVLLLPFALLPWMSAVDQRRTYSRTKELFDAYAANPDIYRDEIFKAAVARLPEMDFYGRHVALDGARVGRYETEVIEEFRKLGIRQETTMANRGRPFLIHQYELTELKWGRWEDGASKNYTLDIAILWPERRIKFNIEIDDPSHKTRPLKDIDRDAVLTERGWFIRRLNHNFLANGMEGKPRQVLKEIVGIVYFFAKYADDTPLEWDDWIAAGFQNRRFKDEQGLAREQRRGLPGTTPSPKEG